MVHAPSLSKMMTLELTLVISTALSPDDKLTVKSSMSGSKTSSSNMVMSSQTLSPALLPAVKDRVRDMGPKSTGERGN